MINAIIEAISVALNGEFGDDYEINMEDIEQDLNEPCFLISCINPTNELFLDRRYFRTNQFAIQYFPKTEEVQRECNDVAERMMLCLEYVTIHGEDKPIRGTKMKAETIDGVLNFFVNYNCFVYKVRQQIPMERLETETNVKEGG